MLCKFLSGVFRLFLPDNRYVAFSAVQLYSDGTFEAEAPGEEPEYITMAVFGTESLAEGEPTLYNVQVLRMV